MRHQKPSLSILEDNKDLSELYARILEPHFDVRLFHRCSELKAFIGSNQFRTPDLFLTDIHLPDGDLAEMVAEDNFEFMKAWPTIVVSVKDDLALMQECQSSWADEYLVKPFNNQELLHKCLQIVEKSRALRLNATRMTLVNSHSESEELSSKEFRIISCLLENHNTVDKEELIEEIWGAARSPNILNTTLSRLRPKLEQLGVNVLINKNGEVDLSY